MNVTFLFDVNDMSCEICIMWKACANLNTRTCLSITVRSSTATFPSDSMSDLRIAIEI